MSHYLLEFTEKSDADLKTILKDIARENAEQALSFVEEIQTDIHYYLSTYPHIWSLFDEEQNIRVVGVRDYNIFYQTLDTIRTVQILHIKNKSLELAL